MPRRVSTKQKAAEEEVEDLEVEDDELEVEDEEDTEPDENEEDETDEEDEEEVEGFDELEVEEDEEDEEEEEVPTRKRKKPAAKKPAAKKASTAPAFGTKELVAHVEKVTGKSFDGRALRIVLRRLANEGVIQRTVGDDRGRYSFTGPNDPQVKAVVAAVKASATEKKKPVAKKPAAKKPVAKKPAKTAARRPTRRKTRAASSEE